jgi:hypothetical protein
LVDLPPDEETKQVEEGDQHVDVDEYLEHPASEISNCLRERLLRLVSARIIRGESKD